MGKAIIFFLIFCLLSSIVIAQNFRYLYSPYTAKLDRTLSLNQSENDMQVSNITASNGTFENLLVKNPPVNCPVNTGMIYTNMTTSTCSNNITDWYRIGSNTVYTIGNVGIGTISPGEALTVIGHINATGNITGNFIYGDISVHPDGNITVDIEIQNIHKNITGFDKTHLNGFKLVDNALVAEVDGEYKVDYWLSTAGGANRIYESCIAVNGEHETPHAHRKQGAAGDIGSMSGGGVITLVAGDIVNLQIRNIDGTQDVDIFNAGMRLERLGDTFT